MEIVITEPSGKSCTIEYNGEPLVASIDTMSDKNILRKDFNIYINKELILGKQEGDRSMNKDLRELLSENLDNKDVLVHIHLLICYIESVAMKMHDFAMEKDFSLFGDSFMSSIEYEESDKSIGVINMMHNRINNIYENIIDIDNFIRRL